MRLIVSVMASVADYCIRKWLDRNFLKTANQKNRHGKALRGGSICFDGIHN